MDKSKTNKINDTLLPLIPKLENINERIVKNDGTIEKLHFLSVLQKSSKAESLVPAYMLIAK